MEIGRSPLASDSVNGAETRGLTKVFAGRKVLGGVDLEIRAGGIHALLGANGSGKSTIVKLLTGVYQPDGGVIVIGGREIGAIASPRIASSLGVAVVHQEAPVIDTFSVAESIAQFRGYPTHAGRIQWARLDREVRAMLVRFDLAIDPSTLAARLSAAERALIAMIIALDRVRSNLKLLILDEVTAALPRNQAEPYLDRVAALARSGVAVLMVTHRLAELHGRASKATVLRDGAVVYESEIRDVDEGRLIEEMVGPAKEQTSGSSAGVRIGGLSALWPVKRQEPARGTALSVQGLEAATLRNLSFEVRPGEIVGIAGLSDSGVTELPKILAGLQTPIGGRISVSGKPVSPRAAPRALIRAGIAVLPADRLRSGGVASLSVAENVLLPELARFWLRPRRESEFIERIVKLFDVRPPAAATLFGKLSGGNQQKAILAKWLALKPRVLVLDDPTSGVDPAARQKIFELLREAASNGIGVLVFSTEPEQLAAFCSRVLIIREGSIASELTGDAIDRQTISRWCYA
jgi:ABC-type sugar transport system ATPase subunit